MFKANRRLSNYYQIPLFCYLGNEIEYRVEVAEKLKVKTPPTAKTHKVSERIKLLLLKDLLWVVRE